MLEPFKNFLSLKGKVNDKYIPFYLKWVTEGYRFLDIPLTQPITNEQKSQFLKHLSKNHEDWQVNQADNALRLYGYFLSSQQSDKSDGIQEKLINDWKAVEEKTIERPSVSVIGLTARKKHTLHGLGSFRVSSKAKS